MSERIQPGSDLLNPTYATIPAELAHHLVSVVASHLDISTSLDSRVAIPRPIDLQAASQPSQWANSVSYDENKPGHSTA